jgi:hypothetical protein
VERQLPAAHAEADGRDVPERDAMPAVRPATLTIPIADDSATGAGVDPLARRARRRPIHECADGEAAFAAYVAH